MHDHTEQYQDQYMLVIDNLTHSHKFCVIHRVNNFCAIDEAWKSSWLDGLAQDRKILGLSLSRAEPQL